MSDTPAAKRQRTGSAASPETIRSKIWYDDGSVILQAESTQCRVHWTVLAQSSPFFANLRGLPQPPDEPRVEGCPVVRLSDSSEDVEHLLQTLYDPLFDSAEQLTFPVVAAIVRLGRKYDFDRLLTAAVARLTATFPRTLTERGSNRYSPAPGRRIVYDPALLFDTINLAIRNGLPALLPTLYFDVLLISEETDVLQTVLTGLHRADGTSVTLSLESQMTLISSRKRVTSAQATHMFGWLNSTRLPTAACVSTKRCIDARDFLARPIFIPLYNLRVMHKWWWDNNFCVECRKTTKAEFEAGSQRFWDMLPKLFGLPPWADLENEV
ncbi:hypothetical protein DFH06DRAFT_1476892 [Mycena polygramma]|nr:hypothetical protein DFH06DRAFT_1476892 [Mycena polygramma]